MVADALNRRSLPIYPSLEKEFAKLNLCSCNRAYLNALEVKPDLEEEIKAGQADDPEIQDIIGRIPLGKVKGFSMGKDGVLRYGNHLCVPGKAELQKQILNEAHGTPYSIHPGGTKIYLKGFRCRKQ